ncbi:MAG: hypothetical protein ABII22_04795 [Candidatus Micrarchaeota archaeon]
MLKRARANPYPNGEQRHGPTAKGFVKESTVTIPIGNEMRIIRHSDIIHILGRDLENGDEDTKLNRKERNALSKMGGNIMAGRELSVLQEGYLEEIILKAEGKPRQNRQTSSNVANFISFAENPNETELRRIFIPEELEKQTIRKVGYVLSVYKLEGRAEGFVLNCIATFVKDLFVYRMGTASPAGKRQAAHSFLYTMNIMGQLHSQLTELPEVLMQRLMQNEASDKKLARRELNHMQNGFTASGWINLRRIY